MRIFIPKNFNYVLIELDGSIWATRYEPKGETSTNSLMLGTLEEGRLTPKYFKLPAMIEDQKRFLTKELEIVTKEGRPYEEIILEKYMQGINPYKGSKESHPHLFMKPNKTLAKLTRIMDE